MTINVIVQREGCIAHERVDSVSPAIGPTERDDLVRGLVAVAWHKCQLQWAERERAAKSGDE